MRISFFGHRDFVGSEEMKKKLIYILEEIINKDSDTELLFGQYGRFDDFAYICANELSSQSKIKKIFVTPYITEDYQRHTLEYVRYKYDGIIYPEIENVPYRFAISARNRWMVEVSDYVICYIDHPWGGAFLAYKLAKRLDKGTINIGRYEK